MKFSLLVAAASLIASSTAAVVERSPESNILLARECGAADSCQGFGAGSDLCNDRCKKCYGDSGYYGRGECCGAMWMSCCCYYD